jgi:hypothetical protein
MWWRICTVTCNVAITKVTPRISYKPLEWFTALLVSVVRHARCKLCSYNTAGYLYDWIIFLSAGVRVFSYNSCYDKPLNCSFCGLHNQNLIPNRDRVFVPLWLTVTLSHLYQGFQEFLPFSMVNPSYVMETNECTLLNCFSSVHKH